MNNQNLLRGLFLMVFSLSFGLESFHYSIGDLQHAGPGLFPLSISFLLLLVGMAMVVRSLFLARVPMALNIKNIALILVSFCGFALISEHLNMIVGIVFMVFCCTLAGSNYSIKRNVVITIGLLIIAFMFQKFLGLNLPLY